MALSIQSLRYQLILRGVREGLSANRILQTLREYGLGIRRQEGLNIIREIRGGVGRGESIKRVAPEFRLSTGHFQPTPHLRAARFMVVAEATVVHTIPNLPGELGIRVLFDTLVTRQQIDDVIRRIISKISSEYNQMIKVLAIDYTAAFMRQE